MDKERFSDLLREFECYAKAEPDRHTHVSKIEITHQPPTQIDNPHQTGQVMLTCSDGSIYEIGLHEFPTGEALLGWVCHLAIKPWMDKAHLWAFAQLVAELKGFNLEPLSNGDPDCPPMSAAAP
jgi:hypothetical protein